MASTWYNDNHNHLYRCRSHCQNEPQPSSFIHFLLQLLRFFSGLTSLCCLITSLLSPTSHISYLTVCLSHGIRVFQEEISGGVKSLGYALCSILGEFWRNFSALCCLIMSHLLSPTSHISGGASPKHPPYIISKILLHRHDFLVNFCSTRKLRQNGYFFVAILGTHFFCPRALIPHHCIF